MMFPRKLDVTKYPAAQTHLAQKENKGGWYVDWFVTERRAMLCYIVSAAGSVLLLEVFAYNKQNPI